MKYLTIINNIHYDRGTLLNLFQSNTNKVMTQYSMELITILVGRDCWVEIVLCNWAANVTRNYWKVGEKIPVIIILSTCTL